MKLSFQKYSLSLKHRFTISSNSRTETPAVIVKLEQKEFVGFGEASLPPYLKESQDSVEKFLRKVNIPNIYSADDLQNVMTEINKKSEFDFAAKAAVNIALNDLLGKILQKPVYQIYNITKPVNGFATSFTIGIDSDEMIREKIREAEEFKILKVKLGTESDKSILKTIRDVTDKPIYADANRGWRDKYLASEMIDYLAGQNVLLVEQPMPVEFIDDYYWLKEKSKLPLIADESVQSFDDIKYIRDAFHGINIKLMKCGGINEAIKMANYARQNNLKIMLGCMTETSCGIAAASQLIGLADYIDLDGNLLIVNDPFKTDNFKNGLLFLNDENGLGISERQNLF